jgi:thioredoxin
LAALEAFGTSKNINYLGLFLNPYRKTFATNEASNDGIKTEKRRPMQVVTCEHCGAKNRVDEIRLAVGEAKCGRCGTPLKVNSAKPFEVTDTTFQREILESKAPVILVDAWAPWCGPCRVIAPVLDQLAAEAQGRYSIAKLNVDENPRIASQYQVSSIPTMLIFKGGKLIDRLIGAQPKQVIAERLARAA